MAKKELEMSIPKISLDDLFSTQKQRDEAKLEKVRDISLDLIDDFPNHPFKVNNDDEMQKMVDSVKDKGVVAPILVRPKEDGRYELISGHRRKLASIIAGINTIPCIIRDLTDDDAIILMVDSNLQREKILPSEKAFAYKMKLDAIKHQGSRSDLTSDQLGPKLQRSNEIISKEVGDSLSQVKRYIRLTYLIPEILDMVDKETIAFGVGVNLSYLKEDEQQVLLEDMQCNICTPSIKQSLTLKELSLSNKLEYDNIDRIMEEQKPNQVQKISFNSERIRSVLPRNVEKEKIEDFVIASIEFYKRYLEKQKTRTHDAR